jgi:hypothetical protein
LSVAPRLLPKNNSQKNTINANGVPRSSILIFSLQYIWWRSNSVAEVPVKDEQAEGIINARGYKTSVEGLCKNDMMVAVKVVILMYVAL